MPALPSVGGVRLGRRGSRRRQISVWCGIRQGRVFLGGSPAFPLIGHAVGNLRADGDDIGIVTVSGDEYAVPAAGRGQGTDFFMGAVQLFL